MTTLHLRNSIGRSPLRIGLPRVQRIWIIRGFLLIPLAFAYFALSPTARAVLPAPDGDYLNENTAEGNSALFSLTSGADNTAIGFSALFRNTTGSYNTATGNSALYNNTTGFENTASGVGALEFNTTADFNTATGFWSLHNNTTGSNNTANGLSALYRNTTGSNNTANGVAALYSNTTINGVSGRNNTANGYEALYSNTTGVGNTASGYAALIKNTTGNYNTADGLQALYLNTIGSKNTASGVDALVSNTQGSNNSASGYYALFSNAIGVDNTANGVRALFSNTGSNNIGLGSNAGINLTSGSNNIDIGNVGVAGESATIRIGSGAQTRTFIAGIRGKTTVNANAVPVVIDSAGQLGTTSSSRRFKKEIKPMDHISEAILGLKPVTFHYNSDTTNTPQFGLIAEEVAEANPDLVVRDDDGKIYTVRYDAVNAMLLNEFLKEHRTVQELKSTAAKQEATIVQQQKDFRATAAQQREEIQALTASLREQALQIQKVSAQLEIIKPAPQTVLNN